MQREGEAGRLCKALRVATEAALLFVCRRKEVADKRHYIDMLQGRNTKDDRSRLSRASAVKVEEEKESIMPRDRTEYQCRGRKEKREIKSSTTHIPSAPEQRQKGKKETPISDKNPYVPHVYVKKRSAEY